MSDTVIRVENLGKKYIIGHQPPERYRALRDVLAHKAKGMAQLFKPRSTPPTPTSEEFWALKDVSFEVKRGDRIGIIGRNGAGKSTLLKILSRITEPTEGRISIKGRVASLLEVGTGFHPELTGRENIYLNGAILGMGKGEIRRKFDEIVAFAEVEKFLDTPVKRYSSGMYVRLAFAVAAHLEPEILVVDEVLAVGDAAFQRKCLGKMEDVAANEGRTVLFVSHNMAAVTKLCSKGIFLANGGVRQLGDVQHVANAYQKSVSDSANQSLSRTIVAFSKQNKIGITDLKTGIFPDTTGNSFSLSIQFNVISSEKHSNIGVGFSLSTLSGVCVANIAPSVTNYIIDSIENSKTCIFECPKIEKHLAGGTYVLSLWLSKPKTQYLLRVEDVVSLYIPPCDVFSTGTYFDNEKYGFVPLPVTCKIEDSSKPLNSLTTSS